MVQTIYTRALKILMEKPFKLWGISLLAIVLSSVLSTLCGVAIPLLGIGVGLLISTAMTIIYLRGYRGEEISVVQLFELFKDWNTIKRVLLGLGWMYLWVSLWFLVPVLGPIIALIRIYQYRLVPYILVFEPEVPITKATEISTQKTEGYKLTMWLADIAYAVIFVVAVFVLSWFIPIPLIGPLFALAIFIAYIVFIALSPLFAGLVQAAFYEEIMKAKSAPVAPVAPFAPVAPTAPAAEENSETPTV